MHVIPDGASDGDGEADDEEEEGERGEGFGALGLFKVGEVVGAGALEGGVFEFLAAGAGVEGGAAVARGEVVGLQVRVLGAGEGVVGGGEPGDELAGAVGGGFVVVVAGKGVSWGFVRGDSGAGGIFEGESGEGLTIRNLPGYRSNCGRFRADAGC